MKKKNYNERFNVLKTYSGYYQSREKLLESASGGAASALSESFIKNGGIVFGVRYSDDFKRAEYCCITDIAELSLLKGSKYASSDKYVQYQDRKVLVHALAGEFLEQGRAVLFFGLGCDIGALKCYLGSRQIDDAKLFTVDLICHGPTYPEVHKAFVERLEKKYRSKISYFSVRYKKKGWAPPWLHAEFENGKVFEQPFYATDYGFAFQNYVRSACLDCKFKGKDHLADLTIGDHWGLDKSMEGYNADGVSIIFTRTEKGEELINTLDQEEYQLRETDTRQALLGNCMFYKNRITDEKFDRERFKKDFEKRGLHSAVMKQRGRWKMLLSRCRKVAGRLFPKPVKRVIKKLLRMK
ncbi:MAG: Coenzyme F420 hydrogenase/dehydrogenase, beta subunit C-terminal domain [Lachnospiraceae bacterium]|nr:Coenzyme F420 hydrogenase/dehydrogenase, beta subunit C-terminal domain [Lachnospiraceae bacterium]